MASDQSAPAEAIGQRRRGRPRRLFAHTEKKAPLKRCSRCPSDCLHRKKINISSVLACQRLGIKEVDEGIWLVSFMRYDLGYFDLEQKTLQTLDNPFGPRLSPMS